MVELSEEEEDILQWNGGEVVVNEGKEVCDAAIAVIVGVAIQDSLLCLLAKALVKGGVHVGMTAANIEESGSCVAIKEVCEWVEFGILTMDDLQKFAS